MLTAFLKKPFINYTFWYLSYFLDKSATVFWQFYDILNFLNSHNLRNLWAFFNTFQHFWIYLQPFPHFSPFLRNHSIIWTFWHIHNVFGSLLTVFMTFSAFTQCTQFTKLLEISRHSSILLSVFLHFCISSFRLSDTPAIFRQALISSLTAFLTFSKFTQFTKFLDISRTFSIFLSPFLDHLTVSSFQKFWEIWYFHLCYDIFRNSTFWYVPYIFSL